MDGLTCAIEHSQEDGGDPGCVTVANPELMNELFEEDADGLGEGIGEACDDETAEEDGPAPAAIRGLDTRGTIIHHGSSHGQEGWFCLT
jgi:hypothetical protein